MVSTFTPNVQLEEPARGDDVGVWDTPVNNNMTLIDLIVGAQTSIVLNNSPVVLASAQYQCKGLIFGGALTASVTITFPTSFTKSYEAFNACSGTSAFTVTMQTTAAGGKVIAVPPGEWIEFRTDGVNATFKNIGRVGSYMDYAGSSVPAWVSGCSIPPYLNCDGTTFSSATYPQLAVILGGNTLPDSRARARVATDQSAGRLSSGVSGFSPNTVGAAGGTQAGTILDANVPAHSHPTSDPGHTHGLTGGNGIPYTGGSGPSAQAGGTFTLNAASIANAVTGVSVANSTYANSAFPVVQPTYVGGLTLIRAG